MKSEKKRFAVAHSQHSPFGAVRVHLKHNFGANTIDGFATSLSLKDAKKLHRELGWSIKQFEREQQKFVRWLIRTNPVKKLFKPQVFNPPPAIRGVR